MRLILVRHAQSKANRDQVGLGRIDSPLTALGERQTEAVAAALAGEPVRRIISSPLRRAVHTAEAIGRIHRLEVETSERLIEMDVGALDGLGWPEVRARYGDFVDAWIADGTGTMKMPGGESLAAVEERAWPLIGPVLESADDGATVAVTHNFVIRTLVCRALGLNLGQWRQFEVDLASRTVLAVARGSTVLQSLNDACHLSADLVSEAGTAERG